jgi:glycosyltransferase involved in cell wall biosynthesis
MSERPSVAFVSRELYPFTGGGIAPMVAASAELLAGIADVTIVTTAFHRDEYERLRAEPDAARRLPPETVRFEFVEEPGEDDLAGYLSHMHGWSARVFEALCELFPDGGPDLVEFPDYLAEGFVTVQARHSGDRRMRNATVCMRAYTTSEMVAVLNGRVSEDFATHAVWEAERYCLAHCDRFVHPGGDVYGTYQRFYGADRIARGHRAHHPVFGDVKPMHTLLYDQDSYDERRLRLLYFGRMERRKGVQNLMRALLSLGRDDWELTFLGGDTDSAPMRLSMRDMLATMAAGDERVRFHDAIPRWEVPEVIKYHDLVVLPSRWECWPNTALESLCQNRAVLATPVGGFTEIVEPGVSGWLADGADWRSLAAELGRLLDARAGPARLAEVGGPLHAYQRLTDRDEILRSYGELFGLGRRPSAAAPTTGPLVSAIVPYFQLDEYVEDTLASLAAQTYENLEIVLVNDGSLRPEDGVLGELADRYAVRLVTQPNAGLGAARNFGISQASGRYVVPLDADDMLAAEFVERCVTVLEEDPAAAYATTWSAYVRPDGQPYGQGVGWAPFGNWSSLVLRGNVAGTCTSVVRRHFFDEGFAYSDELTSYEDWFLYLELHEAGHYGVVLPERLIRYRVRPESMLRRVGAPSVATIYEEMNAHVRERAMRWVGALA